MAPSTDAGEEVTLGVPGEIPGLHIADVAFIDFPGCDQSVGDQVSQPLRHEGIVVVVVGGHSFREIHDQPLAVSGGIRIDA